MQNSLRNIALQAAIPVLSGLIVLNAYLVARNLKLVQNQTTQRVEASEVMADVSNVLVGLQDMERGQKGYLLTGDEAYLQPYQRANERLAVDFAKLRSRLTGKDASLEARLESLAESNIAEMKETIRLRELGYRHRAFQTVSSNGGKQLMDEVRETLDALSSAQASKVALYDREVKESATRAVKESIVASGVLLVATVLALLALNTYRKRLEVGYARRGQELQAVSQQLEQFTRTVFQDFRTLLDQMRGDANTLLSVYGGFLPRQAQERAEHIEGGTDQMIEVLANLSRNSGCEGLAEVDLQELSA